MNVMKNRIPLLFIIVPIFLLQASCKEKIEPGEVRESQALIKGVPAAAAAMTEQPLIYEAVGTVQAGISSKLASKLMGVIDEVRVREGDRVKKGDVLVVIDPRQVKAGVRKAEAGLAEAEKALAGAVSARTSAESEEKLAQITYERYRNLKDKKLVSVQAFDEIKARYDKARAATVQAEALVDAATARIRQAEADLSSVNVTRKDALVNAPHDGIITGKFIDKGDMATPGTPLLSLDTTIGFCVDMILPETYVGQVEPGQKVMVSVPALKTGPLWGNVCTIVPSADQKSRSFMVKINLPVERSVRSGMFARVTIPIGSVKKLLVPRKSILQRGQLTGVYTVDSENTLHFRLVRLGKSFGDSVEVLSGLSEGDRYVTVAGPSLSDGARVEVAP
jgi:RND family efflux transporter MFP subunit